MFLSRLFAAVSRRG